MSPIWSLKTEAEQGAAPDSIESAIDALLSLRGIGSVEDRARFMEPDYDRDLHDPFLFSSMKRVMERFQVARTSGERVGLFGDFDADGITSTVLLHEALTKLGIPVSVYLPDKHIEGHGLSLSAVDSFESDGVTLVVTVDCGMTDHESIAAAREKGMDVIVIDHHHVPSVLPDAYAFVNPRLPGETYPFHELCGAGISFKVLQAVFHTFFPDEREQLKWFLDVAAIGTVADVMPLIGENRTIVTYGLVVLSRSRRHGLREMISRGRIRSGGGKAPVARDISFQIAPRLNAASRMAHAKAAHDLLIEPDADRARELAEILESYNTERQKVSADMAKAVHKVAMERIDRRFVFAAHEDFHFGVVGFVAGKIANEFRKPTIVLTKGQKVSRGSLRSIPELNIIEVIERCGDLLERFGGHAQAAGLTVCNENLEALEDRLEALAAERMTCDRLEPETVVDMRLPQSLFTLDFARRVKRMAQFGEGNPEPIFLFEGIRVEEVRPVGSDGKHLKLALSVPGGRVFDAIGFSLANKIPGLMSGDALDILFQLDENEWNGSVNLQLKLVDMRPSA